MNPAPLLLKPILMDKVWGGDRLARFGKPVAPGSKVGESWELADMGATSASGAGGGAARTLIDSGPFAGQSLMHAAAHWGPRMWGATTPPKGSDFPLLVKFLDAREDLSIQVHPSPEYARAHAGANLKTECWYILDALPGSRIYLGLREGVSRAEFESLVRAGGPGVVGALQAIEAVPGECFNLPSGTVHALGRGVLVAEVQTPSDTTYRLYDWGRAGRAMHFDEGLASAAAAWDPVQGPVLRRGATRRSFKPGARWQRLVDTEFFVLDELRLPPGAAASLQESLSERERHRPAAVIALSGSAQIQDERSAYTPTPLGLGRTALLPAELLAGASVRADAGAHGLTMLRAVVMG
jgi:mannose-6-phosphate isomerase